VDLFFQVVALDKQIIN